MPAHALPVGWGLCLLLSASLSPGCGQPDERPFVVTEREFKLEPDPSSDPGSRSWAVSGGNLSRPLRVPSWLTADEGDVNHLLVLATSDSGLWLRQSNWSGEACKRWSHGSGFRETTCFPRRDFPLRGALVVDRNLVLASYAAEGVGEWVLFRFDHQASPRVELAVGVAGAGSVKVESEGLAVGLSCHDVEYADCESTLDPREWYYGWDAQAGLYEFHGPRQ